MKYYKERYLKTWTKEELVDHILCLQHNLKCEEEGNDHLYKTVTAVMHKDPAFAKAVSEVLEVWNSSFGHRYIDDRKANKPTGGFSELLSDIKKGSFFPDVEVLLQESNTGIKVVSDGLSSNVDKRG